MRSLLFSLISSALLMGCGSTVPLNNVPVADATAIPVSATAGQYDGSGVQSGGVASVDMGQSGAQAALPAAKRIIYFDYDSFIVKPEYQALIVENAKLIMNKASQKVAVEGHTDEMGGREYNLALGQKRAEAVVGALSVLGVPKSQLEAVSFGKEKPAVLGNDEAAYAKNRRAEIRYQ
ncbi:peptidoglycan-associated lipoprotein Pal [Rhodoferax sp.]|uniref:peptidoglycan-associated lipoprotein Pal n=1 Tax=Rhodoferax sp. TaxID=50421 RepID=UPI00283B38C3|nr:peptidoglycan-associated lipoprotein Pal [Rhodoferax sp.]MDR3370201.1 peptidoglycan-associated lipoprotein Pal [Rhodoferax sp.]